MEITVCGLWTASPAVQLPQAILNLQRIAFPGSPDDRIGKQYESTAKGVTKGAKAAAWIANNSSSCAVM